MKGGRGNFTVPRSSPHNTLPTYENRSPTTAGDGPGWGRTTLGYLVRGLIAAGHEVSVYGSESAATAQAALGPGAAYVRVPVWAGKTLRLLTFALNSRRLLKDAGPQVVLSLERVPGSQVYRAGDGCHREFLSRRAPYLRPWPGPPRVSPRFTG